MFRYKKIIFLIVLLLTSCIGLKNKCQAPFTKDCSNAIELWQNTIDVIVLANFPSEIGYYKSVVWEDRFDNAWVNKGHEINITRQFIQKLNYSQKIFVAAHELAHLKLGHYFSKVGIIIPTKSPPIKNLYQNQLYGHYDSIPKNEKTIRAKGFDFNKEEEADKLAIAFIKNVGLDPKGYLKLLLLIQGSTNHPDIKKRVYNMKFFLMK
jgi:hypothetical protein